MQSRILLLSFHLVDSISRFTFFLLFLRFILNRSSYDVFERPRNQAINILNCSKTINALTRPISKLTLAKMFAKQKHPPKNFIQYEYVIFEVLNNKIFGRKHKRLIFLLVTRELEQKRFCFFFPITQFNNNY